MDTLQPALTMIVFLLLLLLGLFLARATGRAQAQRMRDLAGDLREGNGRGLAVGLFVCAMIALTSFCSPK